ncbi:hypothetical protein AQUCO_03100004v1 [Aquilegia coerulea]|uniref:Uncharacterized protein n=1 Tax=Aquilegia coerulea TaxID=218851 RepID=A0A2G5D0C1_AQUCA|nr:hypothetical protein AQUCO_03100004v1 [Aquilegia coerulea]PIA36948.1 hypothetical protein AQUCO_03100004v1 [Aquilegia coerulea]
MISIAATASLCSYCTNKTKTFLISTDISSSNKLVVDINNNNHSNKSILILNSTSSSGGGRRKAKWCWWWWSCNGNYPPSGSIVLSSTATGGRVLAVGVLILLMVFSGTPVSAATIAQSIEQSSDTLANVPQTLSGGDGKKARIQHPKSRIAEGCTIKCVTTCIRGGAGSPGEGPLNARRPLVIFKEGFRSRQYCLVECSDICNLLKDGDDGP